MQCKFALVLRNHSHHAGVVRTWRHFAENHIVALDEHFHAEYAVAAKRVGYSLGNLLRLGFCCRAHWLRLPRIAVVAVDLNMSDRFAKRCTKNVAHREQRDFVVEIDKRLNNHATGSGATAFLGNVPTAVDVVERLHHALTVARTAHDRFNHARHTNLVHSIAEFLIG